MTTCTIQCLLLYLIKDMEISKFFFEPSGFLNFACLNPLFSWNRMHFPLDGCTCLIAMLFPPFWGSYLQIGTTKSSAYVSLTSQLFAYFSGQALVSTLDHYFTMSPEDFLASVIYIVFTPEWNQFLYSLKNKEFKGSLWNL